MSHDANKFNQVDDTTAPPRDALDAMLREWHAVNAVRAAAGRDRLVEALRDGAEAGSPAPSSLRPGMAVAEGRSALAFSFRRIVMHRYTRAAACLALLAGLFALFLPTRSSVAVADAGIVQVPDGGRLEAVDEQGNTLGPCPLKHTDVNATISGPFSRVTVKQTYTNPYPTKIEAVYTFPLSARGAVDRMTMTVGDRVVVGEVKERQKARQIYEQARESGYVASLLEQERPNIFTQSIANIEPGATVEVEIAYVEMLQSRDGEYSFDFPMVVGPRYIPGYGQPLPGGLPQGFTARRGVVLLGPATVTVNDTAPAPGQDAPPAATSITAPEIDSMLGRAIAIATPPQVWWDAARAGRVARTAQFTVAYADGSKELGELYDDGSGQLNGRWFLCPPRPDGGAGAGFAPDTNLVPDASRITPMPVRPPNRAGHDISVTVNIDSGGAPITDVKSELHEVTRDGRAMGGAALDGIGARRTTIALRNQREIPNRDFILRWRTAGAEVQEGVFTHVDEREGGFVTVVIDPPARVDEALVRPRELVFVLDTSGSMGGFPIEKAKEVMNRAIAAMRPQDTFNVITFAGHTSILWPEPRPATHLNRAEAQQFVESRQGGGGTEMMKAIDAALRPAAGPGAGLDAMGLANLPADGRAVTVIVPMKDIGQHGDRVVVKAGDTVTIPLTMSIDLPTVVNPEGVKVRLAGDWVTVDGERRLRVREAGFVDRGANAPMRICMFLTDGYVGNDQAIVQAVRDNAGSTRVFSFGIGNSVNRYLLEQMALAGRGAAEFVTLAEGADRAVERFTRRIQNPVLTDIAIGTAGFELGDIVAGSPSTAPGVLLPDLYDDAPIMFHARVRTPGKGQLVVSGRTGAGPWEKRVDVDVDKPNPAADNPALPVLWARSRVESTLAPHLQALEQQTLDPAVRREVIALGERFGISTPFTSFVAVEKSRVTLGGRPMLVAVPVELPQGTRFQGFFGDALRRPDDPRAWRESMLSAVRQPDAVYYAAGIPASTHAGGAPEFDLGATITLGVAELDAGSLAGGQVRFATTAHGNVMLAERRHDLALQPLSVASAKDAIDASAPARPAAPVEGAPAVASRLPANSTGFARKARAAEQPATPVGGLQPGGPAGGDSSGSGGGGSRGGFPAASAGDRRAYRFELGKPGSPAPTTGAAPATTVAPTATPAGVPPPPPPPAVANEQVLRFRAPELRAPPADAPINREAAGTIFGDPGDEAPTAWLALSAADRAEMLRNVIIELVHTEHWTELGGALASSAVLEDKVAFVAEVDSEEARAVVADANRVRETLLKALERTAGAEVGTAASRTIAMPAIGRPLPNAAIDGAPAKVATLVIYDVADLVAGREGVPSPAQPFRLAQLVDLLQEFVAQGSWMAVGGNDASVRTIESLLAITAPAETHAGVQSVLDAMRRVTASDAGAAARVELASEVLGDLRVFDVSALTKDDRDAANRIEAIVERIEPESWVNNGGDAGWDRVLNGVLVVRHPSAAVLRRVALLVDQLHAAVGVALPADRQEAVGQAQSMSTPAAADTTAMSIVVHNVADIAGRIASEGVAPPPVGVAVASTRLAELIPNQVRSAAWGNDRAEVGAAIPLGGLIVVDQPLRGQIVVDDALNALRTELGLPPKPMAVAPTIAPLVDEIRERRAAETRAFEARLDRVNTLFVRLDGPLFARAIEMEDPQATLVDRAKLESLPAGGDASLAVNVLVDDPSPATVDAVRSAGLSIEGRNDRMKILVGWLPPSRLADVALVDGVRRIERVGQRGD